MLHVIAIVKVGRSDRNPQICYLNKSFKFKILSDDTSSRFIFRRNLSCLLAVGQLSPILSIWLNFCAFPQICIVSKRFASWIRPKCLHPLQVLAENSTFQWYRVAPPFVINLLHLNLTRKNLWSNTQGKYLIPWCSLGPVCNSLDMLDQV